jgi:cytochrome c oxidase subunit III
LSSYSIDEIHLTDAEQHASTALAHHFDNLEQQREAGSLGMWVFLITEIMFFGGLFLAYTIYRTSYPASFAAGSSGLNTALGAANTIVLICSSLTMALAVYYAQTGARRMQIVFLLLTMVLGAAFLVVKGFEYAEKFRDNHVPWLNFVWDTREQAFPRGATTRNIQMFYWLYFAMTGLHALHMIIGLGILAFLVYFAYRGRYTPEYHSPVEISGLYWHFIDIIWIFLFPLLYLLGANLRHG